MDALPLEDMIDRIGSRYSVVVAAAKRARQLKEGAVPLVRCDSNNPLTVALHEIAAGKVVIKPPGEPGDEPAIETAGEPTEEIDIEGLEALAEEVAPEDLAELGVEEEQG